MVIFENFQAGRGSSLQILTPEWNLITCTNDSPREDCVLVKCYLSDR